MFARRFLLILAAMILGVLALLVVAGIGGIRG
jgi:hypothetical protein